MNFSIIALVQGEKKRTLAITGEKSTLFIFASLLSSFSSPKLKQNNFLSLEWATLLQ